MNMFLYILAMLVLFSVACFLWIVAIDEIERDQNFSGIFYAFLALVSFAGFLTLIVNGILTMVDG